MDMLEQRIRDVVATLLSKGARALERTAGELEQAAGELRRVRQEEREEAERVWSEPRREPDATLRGAPLRAVPDTPTDEVPEAREDHPSTAEPSDGHVPPVRPPQTPTRERPGQVDAEVGAPGSPGSGSDALSDAEVGAPGSRGSGAHAPPSDADRLRELATGTVSEIRAQLGGLTGDELRRLRSIEESNRNRTTLLTAIDRALVDA